MKNAKRHDLKVLIKKRLKCICLTESFLRDPVAFSIKDYSTFHRGSNDQSGNLIFLRKNINFCPVNLPTNLNALAEKIDADKLITI